MNMTVFDCSIRGDEGLTDHLSAKDALGAFLGASSPKQVELDLLEIEKANQGIKGCGQRELQRALGTKRPGYPIMSKSEPWPRAGCAA
jgi:hypothetical protein